ncbi:hypothetical protein JA1_002292 [Spathaspora sp. JA1]|nr:hypothetical protein JA1_002292 [Spathaspora sp. JA1]
MTRIILQPGTLTQQFPDASTSQTYRLRIIGQVTEYIGDNSTLILTSIPTLTESSSNLSINIFNQLESIPGDVIRKGTIVSVEGFFDGDTLNVIDIYPINGADVDVESLKTLQKLNDLSSFSI